MDIITQPQIIEGIPVIACRLYEQIRPLYADPAHIELITYPNRGHETPPEMYAQAVRWLQTHL